MSAAFTDRFTKLSFPNLGLVRFPRVKLAPEQFAAVGLKPDATVLQYLKQLSWAGYLAKEKAGLFPHVTRTDATARLKLEFEVFEKTGTLGYILLIYDILQWCDKNNIPRGPARGSCAASFAFYCLDVTKIDPIRFGLTFTRFISEARVKPKLIGGEIYADGKMVMDVDIDISYIDRARVIDYVKATFGGAACGICTMLTLSSKIAIKDAVKVYLGYDEGEAKRVSDWVEARFGKSTSLDTALNGDGNKIKPNPDFQAWVKESPLNQEAFDIACAVCDLSQSKGKHPSGLFIGYEALDGTIPIEIAKDGEVVTSYDMDTVALLGIKVDLLGLRTINVIKNTCDMVGIDFNQIDVNHPSIYQYIATSRLYNGLFQIEDGLTASAVHKIKPRNIDQLGACLAISRPGAFKFIDDFAKYTNEGVLKPIHPQFDAILSETGNILVYQEQINEILQRIYLIPAVDAEDMRRAIGKKVREELTKFEPILYAQGEKQGIPKEVTKYFWDVCNSSADYLFNKSHSASYSYITAYTTYLKANYPRQFMLALLRMSRHESKAQEALSAAIQECPKLGIKILGPDIIKSGEDFEIDENGDIRFGLSHMRGISGGTMAKLASFKKTFETRFQVFEAAKAAEVRINVLVSLIYSGCLDTKGTPRSEFALNAQLYNLLTDREKPIVHRLAKEYNEDLLLMMRDLPNRKDEKGKPLIRESRLETLRRDYSPMYTMYKQNAANEELCCYLFERSLLGFSYSGTLHGCYSKRVIGLIPLADVIKAAELKRNPLPPVTVTAAPPVSPDNPEAAPVAVAAPHVVKPAPFKVVCFVDEIKKHYSKKDNTPYLKVRLYDDTSEMYAMVFGADKVQACLGFNGGLPKDGDIVIATGVLSKDSGILFLDQLLIQPPPIALKASEAQVPI